MYRKTTEWEKRGEIKDAHGKHSIRKILIFLFIGTPWVSWMIGEESQEDIR